jgi:hypothetical protein
MWIVGLPEQERRSRRLSRRRSKDRRRRKIMPARTRTEETSEMARKWRFQPKITKPITMKTYVTTLSLHPQVPIQISKLLPPRIDSSLLSRTN